MTESKPAEGAEEIPVQSDPVEKAAKHVDEVTVGRIVHYQEDKNPPLAALVTAVRGKKASLAVYREHLTMFRQDVPFSEKPKPGHWNWPPRA